MAISDLTEILDEWKESQKKKADITARMTEAAKDDPVKFLESDYGWYDDKTKAPIKLENWERLLLRKIFESKKKRRCIGDIKKNLKTCKSAMIAYANAWRRPCEQYVVANKQKQSMSRAFQYIINVIEMNPYCNKNVKINRSTHKIIFPNGSTIEALPQDAAGEAGANPFCVIFDEVWGMRLEAASRMIEEFTIPATQPEGFQVFTSYAGYEDEETIWRSIYDSFFDDDGNLIHGIRKVQVEGFSWSNQDFTAEEFPLYENDSTLFYWSNGPLHGHPGQQYHTEDYFAGELDTMRSKQFMRLHENKWVSGTEESVFEDPWDNAVKNSIIIIKNESKQYTIPTKLDDRIPLFVGVDGSTKDDHAAVASVYPHPLFEERLAVGPYRVWIPERGKRVVNLNEMQMYLMDLDRDFWVRKIAYDPFQLHQMMTTLESEFGKNRIEEFNQSPMNLIKASENLYDLLTMYELLVPADARLKWYAHNAVAEDKERGWRIKKPEGRLKKKIDWVAAFSTACYFAVKDLKLYQGTKSRARETLRDKLRQQMATADEERFARSVGSDMNGQSKYAGDGFGGSDFGDILDDFERSAY